MSDQHGNVNLLPLFETAVAASAMSYPGMESRFGMKSPNMSRIGNQMTGNALQASFMDPMYLQYLRCNELTQVTEDGKQELPLVATVGKFSVIWNFQQVKCGSHECYRNQVGLKSCYCYKIVPKDDSIVDSRFMHEKFAVSDSPEAPLVATPFKVLFQYIKHNAFLCLISGFRLPINLFNCQLC
ncbi:hypothetical protein L1987_65101 [Smallanthus sonchifolius]|uniref:Uncharacterized protein n=1 Tax=Smallanthus sonchifolius TaxID=185202 RepID=A0ACB9BTK1_9ASTR|nr:hypothetical protein L1987_65101 [Smallanthus sonchifolius]